MDISALSSLLAFVIAFVLALLAISIVASTLVEAWAGLVSARSRMLRERLAEILDDPRETGFAHRLFASPLVRSLQQKGRFPDYIPSETFAQAVVSVIKEHRIVDPRDLPPVLRALALAEGFGTEEERAVFREKLIQWYDKAMDRLSGTYRLKTRTALFVAGLGIAVIGNVNLLDIGAALWAQRSDLAPFVEEVDAFQKELAEAQSADPKKTIEELLAEPDRRAKLVKLVESQKPLAALVVPLGWSLESFRCPDTASARNDSAIKDGSSPGKAGDPGASSQGNSGKPDGSGNGNSGNSVPGQPAEQAEADGSGNGTSGNSVPGQPAEQAEADGSGNGNSGNSVPGQPAEQAEADGSGNGTSGSASNSNTCLFGKIFSALTNTEKWSARAIFGWLLTAIAVLPGAAFWFDALGRVLSLRSVGKRPDENGAAPGSTAAGGAASGATSAGGAAAGKAGGTAVSEEPGLR